ncbi:MAG: sensor histidine kinase [Acetobacteraceae bacterium]|nr:MAG: sensor histidine kinase [Acetobacteraceae bacterium]
MKHDWLEHFYPVRDPETDDLLGVGLVCEEVTERKHAERARELLLRELDHRVKNLFAIIGGLVSFTARAAVDTAAMRNTLLGRIQALAQAHDLVRPALGGPQAMRVEVLATGGTSLETLVLALLRPFQAEAGEAERLALDGPPVRLGPIAAPPMALALHELATNAAKYGALTRPSGAVAVHWSEAADDMLQLVWREEGGPSVDTPRRAGFGHRLVTQSAAQLGGQTRFDWRPAGLRVELLLPRDRLQH